MWPTEDIDVVPPQPRKPAMVFAFAGDLDDHQGVGHGAEGRGNDALLSTTQPEGPGND